TPMPRVRTATILAPLSIVPLWVPRLVAAVPNSVLVQCPVVLPGDPTLHTLPSKAHTARVHIPNKGVGTDPMALDPVMVWDLPHPMATVDMAVADHHHNKCADLAVDMVLLRSMDDKVLVLVPEALDMHHLHKAAVLQNTLLRMEDILQPELQARGQAGTGRKAATHSATLGTTKDHTNGHT
ncbi:hypothetical protein BGZ58_007205, partial [Dissophora ornata]